MNTENTVFRTSIYSSPSSTPFRKVFTTLNDAKVYVNTEENIANMWMYEIQQVITIYNKKNKTTSESRLIIERQCISKKH